MSADIRTGTTLYRSSEITITHRHVTVDGIRIPVGRLLPIERCLTFRYPMLRVAAVTGGIELAIALPIAVAQSSALMVGVGLLSAAGMLAGAWGDARRNPRRMEIHATVRGQWVVLYSTTDHREFGRVERALIRAVEHHRDHLF